MGQVFERTEVKYVLSSAQYEKILPELLKHFRPDDYGLTTIQSLYFDTCDCALIRRSIEKPVYKEKMRMRCYGPGTESSTVYLELKKKYKGIVYKRRIQTTEKEAYELLEGKKDNLSQIEKELVYFKNFYKGLAPKIMVLYDRLAYIGTDNDLRLTIDENLRYRMDNLTVTAPTEGKQYFDCGERILEIKANGAYPLWLCRILNDNKIYKSSFSKYGSIYEKCSDELYKKRDNNV